MPVVAPTSNVAAAQNDARTERVAPGFGDSLQKAGEVAPQHTPLTGSQATAAMADAYRARFGRAPSNTTLAILGAQWSLETGGGGAMMNYNFGGIKGAGPSGMSVRYRTVEGSGRNEVHITDRFRAYASASEGAGDYMAVLEKRFPKAFAMAQRGDAVGFVRELKQASYFTGDEKVYTKVVSDLSARAERDGFDVLGRGLVPSHAKPSKEPAATTAPPAPTTQVDEVRLELLRMTHALDEAALGIMQSGEPRTGKDTSALLDGLRANEGLPSDILQSVRGP